jgi:hypothetical protein
MPDNQPKKPSFFHQALPTILTAIPLAVLMVLTVWGFELRSLRNLAIQSSVVALCLALPVYTLVFRKNKISLPSSSSFWMAGICLSIAFALLVVPSQSAILRYFLTLVITAVACLILSMIFLLPLFTHFVEIPAGGMASLTLLGGLIGMGILLYNSLSARMYGDDFCYALVRESKGYLQSVIWFYNHWSGRFFSNFLLMGFNDKSWIVAVQLLGISAACFIILWKLIEGSTAQRVLTALAGAVWAPLTIFIITPDLYKSVYWIVSSVAVLPVLILVPLYLALLWRFRKPTIDGLKWAAPLATVISFAIATTHEAAVPGWLALQIIGFAIAWRFIPKNHSLQVVLGCGALAAAAGLAVELLSPGIDARAAAQNYPPAGSLIVLIQLTCRYFFEFILSIPSFGWLMILAAAGLGWSLKTALPRRLFFAAAALLISIGMALACFIPGAYAMSSSIPLRTQVIPSAYLVYGIVAASLLLPRPTSKVWAAAAFALALLLTPTAVLQSMQHILPTVQPMQLFARDWDARDNQARRSDIEIQPIPIPWDEQEQEFSCTQNYYRNH